MGRRAEPRGHRRARRVAAASARCCSSRGYRPGELPAGSIHREWRARLLSQRLGEEVQARAAHLRRRPRSSRRSSSARGCRPRARWCRPSTSAPTASRSTSRSCWPRSATRARSTGGRSATPTSRTRSRTPSSPATAGCRPTRRPWPAPERSSGGASSRRWWRACSTGRSPTSTRPIEELVAAVVPASVQLPRPRLLRLPPPAAARRAVRHGPGRRAPAAPRPGGRVRRRSSTAHPRSTLRSTSSAPGCGARHTGRRGPVPRQRAVSRAGASRSSSTGARSATCRRTRSPAELAQLYVAYADAAAADRRRRGDGVRRLRGATPVPRGGRSAPRGRSAAASSRTPSSRQAASIGGAQRARGHARGRARGAAARATSGRWSSAMRTCSAPCGRWTCRASMRPSGVRPRARELDAPRPGVRADAPRPPVLPPGHRVLGGLARRPPGQRRRRARRRRSPSPGPPATSASNRPA